VVLSSLQFQSLTDAKLSALIELFDEDIEASYFLTKQGTVIVVFRMGEGNALACV
jgi:hypothetical protein